LVILHLYESTILLKLRELNVKCLLNANILIQEVQSRIELEEEWYLTLKNKVDANLETFSLNPHLAIQELVLLWQLLLEDTE